MDPNIDFKRFRVHVERLLIRPYYLVPHPYYDMRRPRSGARGWLYTDNTPVDIHFIVTLLKYDLNAIPFHYSFLNSFRPCVFG